MKKIIFAVILVFLVLTACSQIRDMQDTGQVQIHIGPLDEGDSRYLASNGSSVIVAFLQDNDVYLYEEYDTVSGTIGMNGILEGDYILLVLLQDESDDVVSLGTKAVTITAGINYIDVTLGPGIWGLKLNDVDLDLTDLPSGYGLTVGENSLVFDVPDTELKTGDMEVFKFEFSTNAVVGTFSLTPDMQFEVPPTPPIVTVEVYGEDRSFGLHMTDPQYGESFTYTISFE